MNVKELIESKKEYFENERMFSEEINQFIRKNVKEFDPESYAKNDYIQIEFNEVGKYGDYELEITSVADYLTDEVIGALVREYDLIVTYKCSQTGFNMGTGEVNRQSRVYFRYAELKDDDVDEVVEEIVEELDEDEELE